MAMTQEELDSVYGRVADLEEALSRQIDQLRRKVDDLERRLRVAEFDIQDLERKR